MPDVLQSSMVLLMAFVASTLAGVTGFGGAAVLLPVLVAVFGVREAIPILTIAQLAGNGSRVWFNRRELDWRVVGWFALGGAPMALIGGLFFARAPVSALTRVLGVFLIAVVVWRHVRPAATWRPSLPAFAVIGAVAGFLSAVLGSVGPLMAPFFLAYGLVKNAYIGTEALATVTMHVVKLVAYRSARVLPLHAVLLGIFVGPAMVLGSYTGKQIVQHLSPGLFVVIIEVTLLVAGGLFLWKG